MHLGGRLPLSTPERICVRKERGLNNPPGCRLTPGSSRKAPTHHLSRLTQELRRHRPPSHPHPRPGTKERTLILQEIRTIDGLLLLYTLITSTPMLCTPRNSLPRTSLSPPAPSSQNQTAIAGPGIVYSPKSAPWMSIRIPGSSAEYAPGKLTPSGTDPLPPETVICCCPLAKAIYHQRTGGRNSHSRTYRTAHPQHSQPHAAQ